MSNFTQMELNSIRECVTSGLTTSSKLSSYANKACDTELKELFKSSSTKAEESAKKLIQLL